MHSAEEGLAHTKLYDDVPTPETIPCPACEGESFYQEASYECSSEPPEGASYLRVPSRKAAIAMAREGHVVAQLVVPTEPGDE